MSSTTRTGTSGIESRAIKVAIACATVGAVTKLVVGMMTGSMAMVSSAVDSTGDLLVSIANLFVVRIAAREPDEGYNYGYAKIEGLGAMFEGGFIAASAAFILYESVHKIVSDDTSHGSPLGLYVMPPLIGLTIATVAYLRRTAKATGSLVLRADAAHYTTDVYVNIGVLVALALVKVTGKTILDPLISIAIALTMLRTSAGVVREGFGVVMDQSLPAEIVERITAILASTDGLLSFHELKTRSGRHPLVDFHVVVTPETTTRQVHAIFLELRTRIAEVAGESAKVLMHADPAADDG